MSLPHLEYASKSQMPWHRRRAARRWLTALALLIAATFCWRAAPPLWRQLQGRWILHRCVRFTAPADRLVFERDPIKAKTLVAANREYWNELDMDLSPSSPVASWAPPIFVELLNHVEGPARIFRLAPPVAFLHERTSPDGARRLVLLRYSGTVTYEGGPTTHTFVVNLFNASGDLNGQTFRTYQPTMLQESQPFSRLYFGQPDPADASHFSFKYETETGSGIVDGWLCSDHEVKLECRDGPEKLN